MPHSIFGDRFYNRATTPAWHRLGITAPEPLPALEALELLDPPYVTLDPVFVRSTTREGQLRMHESPSHRAIVQHPTNDADWAVHGIVGPDYRMLTAHDAAEVWQAKVRSRDGLPVPVETMGFLYGGSRFFISALLPSIDVRGDEVEMYLGTVCPLDGVHAATAEQWPFRPVCANTLRLAQQHAVQRYRIVHDETAKERLGDWLAEMYLRALDEVEVVQEALAVLADVTTLGHEVEAVLKAAYPDPSPVRMDAPAAVLERREVERDKVQARVVRLRANANELYDGKGRGMDLPATKGTFYGLVQAVVETECWRKGWNRNGREDASVAEAVLVGARGDAMRRAHQRAIDLVKAR